MPRRVGNGAGWGGPAKGAGNPTPRPPFDGTPGPGRGHYSIKGEEKRARDERLAEEMRALYYDVAMTPDEPTPNRLAAATHLLNRIEGAPIARQVTAQIDDLSQLTDEQLAAERARIDRMVSAFSEARMGAPVPPRSDSVDD